MTAVEARDSTPCPRLDIHQLFYMATDVSVVDDYLADLDQQDLLAVRLLQAACGWNVSGMSEIIETWREAGGRREQVLSRAALAAFDIGSTCARFSWSPEQFNDPKTFQQMFGAVDALLAAGANLHMAHVNAGCFVHTAASSRSGAMMRFALDRGCDPNQVDEDGIRPLQRCLSNRTLGDNLSALKALLKAGADPTVAAELTEDQRKSWTGDWTYDPQIVFTILAYGGALPHGTIGSSDYADVTPLKAAARCKDHERILGLMQASPVSATQLQELRTYLAATMESVDPAGYNEVRATIEACASHQILRGIAASARRVAP